MTTVTRGEQSVTSESLMSYSTDNAQRYPAVAHDKRSLKFRVVDDKVSAGAAKAVGRCPNIGALSQLLNTIKRTEKA